MEEIIKYYIWQNIGFIISVFLLFQRNKCSIKKLIESSYEEIQNNNFPLAKDMVHKAMSYIDKEKENAIASEETTTTENQLNYWYKKCFHILFLVIPLFLLEHLYNIEL